jgi:prolyl-tRNA synthetase
LANGTLELARRDTLTKEIVQMDGVVEVIKERLEQIQQNLFAKADTFRTENTREANSWEEFEDLIKNTGGFVLAHWDGTPETEDKIKDLTKATIRCIPLDAIDEEGTCILTGKPSQRRVLFAKAY